MPVDNSGQASAFPRDYGLLYGKFPPGTMFM